VLLELNYEDCVVKTSFLDRLINKLDAMDSNSIQSYILRLSKEKGFMDTVFNTVKEGIMVIDRQLMIQYHNKAATELLGLPDDLSNVRLSQFLREVDWKRIMAEDDEEWYKLSRQEVEIMYPVRRVLQFYLVPHSEMKDTATVIINDVTDSVDRSREALESEKIHFISMLAASVAHEIGNPLNSIYLHLQLMQRHLSTDEPVDVGELKELLDTSKREVERLDTIITQFLGAIRPTKPIMEPVALKELIVESLNFMKVEIQDRLIEVKCAWPDQLPIISGDANQLKQAFYNILKNGMQAMPQGGAINIECSFDDDYVELVFADTGEGIDAEKLSDIFKPYHTSKETGSGLGLMVIERVVREHGAELSVNSEPDEGTSFIIRFPRHGRRTRFLEAPVQSAVQDKTEKLKPRNI